MRNGIANAILAYKLSSAQKSGLDDGSVPLNVALQGRPSRDPGLVTEGHQTPLHRLCVTRVGA